MRIVPVIEMPSKEDVKPIVCEEDRWVSSYYGSTPYTRLLRLFQDLREVCHRHQGIGVSAVQVGLPLPVFIAKIDDRWRYFLNCEYSHPDESNQDISLEGCLSLRNSDGYMRRFQVLRWNLIHVTGQEFEPKSAIVKSFIEVFKGFNAVVMQHEIDHQNDILISDIGQEVNVKRVI